MGRHFAALYPHAFCPELDATNVQEIASALKECGAHIVINCVGKTGRPNIDWCEDHKEETLAGNVIAPLQMLRACKETGARLVHMSSGCIYQGDNGGRGFSEEDPPNYTGSFYSRSKIWSETMLKEFPVLILRIRMPFDGTSEPRNLITKIMNYSRLLTSSNSLTCVPDFLQAADALITRGATGVYNIVNEGTISPFAIMERYKAIVDPSHSFAALDEAHIGEVTKAGRSNCVLSTAKIRGEGLGLRPVEEAVDDCLKALAEAKKPALQALKHA